MNSFEIRNSFLDFFKSKQHMIVPSAPIVVKNDPTLMFTNAGMNQFKDVFLGNQPAKAPRATDAQKCLRVSGKHNDLEEVGNDTYHHTMFEMLGNWSFGDYFKKEAIAWAWEYLTEVVKIDKSRLYVTVFGGDAKDNMPADDEAKSYWKEHVDESRIIYGNKKDNFWEMGETGPCGPCSEIHVDIRDDAERAKVDGKDLVNKDNPEVIEIWNLVFMQFNRLASGQLVNLPACHVDTGMGFERLCMVLQGKKSNYDTDVFQPLIQKVAQLSGTEYGKDRKCDVAMRVIADHLRAVSFAIADGQLPSNNGAGYVIRRILRRAVRYGYTFLHFENPFVYQLLPTLVEQMGHNYPEIRKQQELVSRVIFEEESSFLRTLAQGIRRFETYADQLQGGVIDGAFAFELFDTYGFPVDLTALMASEHNLTIDMDGFKAKLDEQKSRSRKAAEVASGDWVKLSDSDQPTRFIGYDQTETESHILRFREVVAKKAKHYEIVLDTTPFYAEMGGQVGDSGKLVSENETIVITNTIKENNLSIHITDALPQYPDSTFKAVVDVERRRQIEANHSATHLMHAALRQVLGTHVEQKGSLVDAERLRFDFSHFSKMTPEQISEVEAMVNAKIRENIKRHTAVDVPIEEAKNMGAMALFGEKYADKVRVVTFGEYSKELCGGTHVDATGNIGMFKIVSESAIAAGVRRIEAITGKGIEKYLNDYVAQVENIRLMVKATGDLNKAIESLCNQNQVLQKQVEQLLEDKARTIANQLAAKAQAFGNYKLVNETLQLDLDQLRNVANMLRQSDTGMIAVLAGVANEKPSLCLLLPESFANERNLDAGAIIREAAREIQGGGGGQRTLSTAGGRNIAGLAKAVEIIISKLS